MGNTRWTHEQQQAIDARGCSLLVAAAAGAGKTAVLVERIIQRIIDEKSQVDIDKLLVVTFTNAAAAEMRERIGEAVSAELEKNPDSVKLQKQIALLNRAQITTIHSFCLEVIRENFHAIDLDPSFRVGDETETLLLKQEALEELFEEMYEDENSEEDFLNLVDSYGGGRTDSALQEMVLKLYEFSQSMPDPNEWLKECAQRFNTGEDFDFSTSIWAKILMDGIRVELLSFLSMMNRAVSLMEGIAEMEPYYNHFSGEAVELEKLLMCCSKSWDELIEALGSLGFETLPRCKKGSDKELQTKVKAIRDEVKKGINKIRGQVSSFTSEKISEEMKKLYPAMNSLVNLVIEFSKKYSLKKREKNIIDFNDIEHFCIDILTEKGDHGEVLPSKAALMYREKFEEIYIDEYQDSNMVQELILTTISRKNNIFMVGDVKQSIYRFRQAKPELFLEKYNTYEEEGSRERKILLYKNFRSRREIIDGVNYIFKSTMSVEVGELEYDDREKLTLGAEYLEGEGILCGGPIELHLIESSKDKEEEPSLEEDAGDSEEEEDLDSIQLEARMVSRRIRELVSPGHEGFKVYDRDTKSFRPAEYRDIVILMRATSSYASVYMEELSSAGIPVYADTGSGYFEITEVQIIISLLQIIDNPMQDIPLIAVLRSPIASFTEEELMDIRRVEEKKPFYEALKAKSLEEDELGVKARSFMENLKRWRDRSLNTSISEFIWYLYGDTGYYAYVGGMPGGVQRQANLRVLFDRARQYEDTSFKGLFNFINFINKLKKSSGDMGEAKILGEKENVVRIMSIHKSKGLEFPIVFACGMGKKFNMKDLNNPILFHHQMGFGPDYVDSKRRLSYQTVIKHAVKRKIRLESLSEEMRILYVAFTRAKEKLIITGSVRGMEKSLAKWASCLDSEGIKVPQYQVLKGENFLDWICPALMKHSKCPSLREAWGGEIPSPSCLAEDDSRWSVKIWSRKEILEDDTKKSEDEAAAGSGSMESEEIIPYSEEIRRRLEWEYPYRKSSMIPAKISVTELKRKFGSTLEDEYSSNIFLPSMAKKPQFLERTKGLTAAEKGTIMHLVMEKISFDKVPTPEDIRVLIDNMVAQEYMTPVEASSVDVAKVLEFFKSPIGKRAISSGTAKREVPFYMEIESCEVYRDLPKEEYEGEKILLQGIIDCYFEEPDGLVLLDYKTDYVDDYNISELKKKYEVQIEYYAMALERMTGKAVKEKYIYLFSNGQVIEY